MALKNKKAKYIPAKIMAGITAVCFTGLVYHCIAHGVTEGQINNIVKDTISTHEFVDYKEARNAELYQAYKSGIISAKEFNDRSSALLSADEVLKNREHYMSEEDASRYAKLKEKDEGLQTGAVAAGGAAILGVFGVASCYTAEEYKRRQYADYHSMDLC